MKKIIIFIILIHTLFAQQVVLKDEKVMHISAEGSSIISTGITFENAMTFALNEAKNSAIEYAGIYVESNTKVLNNQLVKDEIIQFSGTIVKIIDKDFTKKLVNNQFILSVKILAAIDTDLLYKRINEVRNNNNLKKMLEAEKERNDLLTQEIKKLQNNTSNYKNAEKIANSLKASEWYNKGIDARLVEEIDTAIEYYTKAIELDDTFGYAYNNRGSAYFLNKNYIKAENDLKRALICMPNDIYPYYNLGFVYVQMKRKQDAINNFNRFLALQKNSDKDSETVRKIIKNFNN